MKDDDVEFGGVKADESDIGGEGDRHTQSCDLDLRTSNIQSIDLEQTQIQDTNLSAGSVEKKYLI